ncbi:hypothetical protein [Amycolatopsis albispora]|uniref:Uncharacterized protein n=1 Tax=Amycolatopsis albispora TaxID=1804986 RepID=A0A344LA79_9PSEU|nr:hypothetical protein [Amycolatopsis albispora]AXB44953.1 hypothetical protein A4R43_22675 [Amycolatopsis albispora]
MVFMHPELRAAAGHLVRLRAAAEVLHAPDPLDALRYTDCAPAALRGMVERARIAQKPLAEANADYGEARIRAGFGERGTLAGAYRDEREAIERTVLAGLRVADQLDLLARAAARYAVEVAVQADPACVLVLDGDLTPEPAEVVHEACAAIVRTAEEHLVSIDALTSELDGLIR